MKEISEMLSTQDYLALVSDRSRRNLPLKRVYRNIRNENLFLTAYGNLYANDGALTPGIDPGDTIQGMSRKRIAEIIAELKEGCYKWTPARTVYIPKKGGERRLSMPGWKDKLLQEVIRLVLEAYYEPKFKDSSHGYRPGRGCHTALQHIQANWTGTKWFIEGDIKGCFDNIDHTILLTTIGEDIQDQRFVKLLRGMLEAGYMEEWEYHKTYSGTPQGGVLSPLLANVMLHKLDTFVEEELIPHYTKGKCRRVNPEYRRVQKRMAKAKAAENREAYKELKRYQRQLPSKRTHDEQYGRLRYVRYADDFILGFIGNKQDATVIRREIREFLASINLTLSEEKTLITHAASERARFLNYEIATKWDDSKLIENKDGSRQKQRRINGNIGLYVPQSVKQEWISRYMKNGKPCKLGKFAQASDFEVVKEYGAKLRGLANYYSLAENLSYGIGQVRWVMLQSLVKTLKRNRRTPVRAIYKKYYKRSPKTGRLHIRVEILREEKSPLVTTFGEESLRSDPKAYIRDDMPAEYPIHSKSELVQRLLAEKCEVCGEEGPTEAHHSRRLADVRKRYEGRKDPPEWAVWMMRRNRKSIFVCRTCHEEITFGRYDGSKLR
jgi:group II intron reverse transcriptase/maturase